MTATIRSTATQVYKKVLGTTAISIAIIAGLLISTGQVNALFTFINGHINVSGTVLQVHGASFDIDTGGTHPFQVIVDTNTSYESGIAGLHDLEPGDTIRIQAREDQGNVLAQSVSPRTGSGYGYGQGYGQGCEELHLNNVYVSSISGTDLVLSRANITFEVAIGDFTNVVGGSFDDIASNQIVTVVGSDCGDEGFQANQIILFQDDPIALCDAHSANAYVVYNDTVLLSHDEGGAFSPVLDVNIPAGNYDVFGVSFDDHATHTWDTSTIEQWFATGWYNGEQVYTSNDTTDLADADNRNSTQIGNNVTFTNGLDAIQLVHSAFPEPNYNSILPECVIFEPVGDDGGDVIGATTVHSCEAVPANALVVRNDQVLLSHDEGGAITPEFPVAFEDGTYDVYGVSFDHHSQNPWDTFDGEQWFFTAFSNGAEVYQSGTTDDLPDNLDRNVTQIGTAVAMSDITGISYTHASFPNPDFLSILPECVVLVPSAASSAAVLPVEG